MNARLIDQVTRGAITVSLAIEGGKIMGIVLRPTIRSPNSSLKSCAWIEVINIPALIKIDKQATSSRPQCLGSGNNQWDTSNKKRFNNCSLATRVAPASNEANPAALTTFLTTQWPLWAEHSLYITVKVIKAKLAPRVSVLYIADMQKHTGTRTQRRKTADLSEMRFDGIGRSLLFLVSSSGPNVWLETSNWSKCSQIQKTTCGSCEMHERGAAAMAKNV